jgi:hypothetical protein
MASGDVSRNSPFFSKTRPSFDFTWNAPDSEKYRLDVGTSGCGAINLEKFQDFS